MNIKRLALVFVLFVFVVGGCMAKAQNNSYVADVQNFAVSGWTADDEEHVWTLASVSTTADADVYVVTVNADVTGTIGANFKVRLKDGGTTKYFGVLSVSAYSGGVTTLYLFGGTDYVLSGTISEFSYSVARSPFGWPMNPDKWTIQISDVGDYAQASPVANQWYNINSLKIILPAGLWVSGYDVYTEIRTSTTFATVYITLSTSDVAESTPAFTRGVTNSDSTGTNVYAGNSLSAFLPVDVASETTFYLNTMTWYTSGVNIYNAGSLQPIIIRAVWGGL